jgi:hypothetical protein
MQIAGPWMIKDGVRIEVGLSNEPIPSTVQMAQSKAPRRSKLCTREGAWVCDTCFSCIERRWECFVSSLLCSLGLYFVALVVVGGENIWCHGANTNANSAESVRWLGINVQLEIVRQKPGN